MNEINLTCAITLGKMPDSISCPIVLHITEFFYNYMWLSLERDITIIEYKFLAPNKLLVKEKDSSNLIVLEFKNDS